MTLQRGTPSAKPRLPGDPPLRGKMTAPGTLRRIRPRSTKRAAEERDYLKIRDGWLEGKRCQAGLGLCGGGGDQVHHMKGRIGSLLTDTRWWLPVCARCHQMITDHEVDVYGLGLSYHRNDTQTEPPL